MNYRLAPIGGVSTDTSNTAPIPVPRPPDISGSGPLIAGQEG